MNISEFLSFIDAEGPWHLSYGAKPSRHTVHADVQTAGKEFADAQSAGQNTWFRWNRCKPGTGANGSVKDEDVTHFRGIPIDVDLPESLKSASAETIAEWQFSTAQLLKEVLNPTIIACSGNGIAAYLMFEQPQTLKPERYTAIVRGVARFLAQKRIPADVSISNPSRLMRLPGGRNFKRLVEGLYPSARVLSCDGPRVVYSTLLRDYYALGQRGEPLDTLGTKSEVPPSAVFIPPPANIQMPFDNIKVSAADLSFIQHGPEALNPGEPEELEMRKAFTEDESRGIFYIVSRLVACGNREDAIHALLMTKGTWTHKNLINKPDPAREIQRKIDSVTSGEYNSGLLPYIRHNRKFSIVRNIGGKMHVVIHTNTDVYGEHSRMTKFNLIESYMDATLPSSDGRGGFKDVKAWDRWFTHAFTVPYDSATVALGTKEHYPKHGVFNMWRGWNVTPKAGSWELMKRHILEVVCHGNTSHYDWILNWMAWGVQRSGPMQSVIVLKGMKGTGKSVLAETYASLFHTPSSTPLHKLIGPNNGILADNNVHILNEYFPGNKAETEALKDLVTNPTLTVRKLYADAFVIPNNTRLFITSNNEFVVRADMDERRWAVFTVSARYMQKAEYFEPLFREINSGGRGAMLHDLLCREIPAGSFSPFRVPQTDALVEQKMETLDTHPIYGWLYEGLTTGSLPASAVESDGRLAINATEAADYVSRNRQYPVTAMAVATALKSIFGAELCRTNKTRDWTIPPLSDARYHFIQFFKLTNFRFEYEAETWSENPFKTR